MTSLVPPTRHALPRGPLAGFAPAFGWGLRLALGRRRRILLVGLIAAGVGALTGWFGTHSERGTPLGLDASAYQLWQLFQEAVLPFCVPLAALTLVSGAFQREVSERTLVFHLVRPISRRTLYLARFFSAVVVAIPVALLTPLVALWVAGLPLGGEVQLHLVPAVGLGVLALGAVTYLLAAWFRHGIIAGLIYVFLLDSFLSQASGTMQRLSTLHHVLSIHHRGSDAAFAALSERVRTSNQAALEGLDRSSIVFSGLDAEQIPWMESGAAALVLLGITIIALALGAWKVARSDFPLKD